MPGNEIAVCRLLAAHIGETELPHIGLVERLEIPGRGIILRPSDCPCTMSNEAQKKADIIVNSLGVSIKQVGASFSFNRIQRDRLLHLFKHLNVSKPETVLLKLDNAIAQFHTGKLQRRNQPWSLFFSEDDFRVLLEFLMMVGSPNCFRSHYPAKFILEAPPQPISVKEFDVLSFDEYYAKYRSKFKIALRRQWVGQSSDSEHKRALGLAQKPDNAPWVFKDVVGSPRTGWRENWSDADKRTVYFLMIEKTS